MNHPYSDNLLQPPDQEEIERPIRDLFKDGDIRKTATYTRDGYSTLLHRLNANDPTESVAYQFALFLYGAEMAKPGLGEAIWQVFSRLRPRRVPPRRTGNGFDAAYHNFRKALADFEDGLCTREHLEDAKGALAELVAGAGHKDEIGMTAQRP